MKSIKTTAAILMALLVPVLSHAAPSGRAERGLKNLLLGWTDIPRSVIAVTGDTRNPVWGITAGAFKGICTAFPRTLSGITDIVLSPAAGCDSDPVKPGELSRHIR